MDCIIMIGCISIFRTYTSVRICSRLFQNSVSIWLIGYSHFKFLTSFPFYFLFSIISILEKFGSRLVIPVGWNGTSSCSGGMSEKAGKLAANCTIWSDAAYVMPKILGNLLNGTSVSFIFAGG